MVGHAYVYPIGLEDSISRYYPGRDLRIVYSTGAMSDTFSGKSFDSRSIFYFRYLPGQGSIEEVGALQK
jgi:hypothetical protein